MPYTSEGLHDKSSADDPNINSSFFRGSPCKIDVTYTRHCETLRCWKKDKAYLSSSKTRGAATTLVRWRGAVSSLSNCKLQDIHEGTASAALMMAILLHPKPYQSHRRSANSMIYGDVRSGAVELMEVRPTFSH